MIHARAITGGGGRTQRQCNPAAIRSFPPAALADLRQVHVHVATILGVPRPSEVIAVPERYIAAVAGALP
eukprot:9335690-Lingulodinium_polyedra.AAC.1